MAGQLRYPFHDVRSPRQMIRHPWRSLRAGRQTVRHTVSDVRRSTFRPRTVRPQPGEPCTWATDPPVLEEVSGGA
jgi:hypothetical protein